MTRSDPPNPFGEGWLPLSKFAGQEGLDAAKMRRHGSENLLRTDQVRAEGRHWWARPAGFAPSDLERLRARSRMVGAAGQEGSDHWRRHAERLTEVLADAIKAVNSVTELLRRGHDA